ncbi:MAG TPA: hypothetical protein PKC84_13780, partial [Paracoccaceae bacterium]|nr:hypothetical protein [Paracoccaceae bacterium]
PPMTFALLLTGVIAAAGATIALVLWAGFPLVALGLAVLLASLWPGLRRWKNLSPYTSSKRSKGQGAKGGGVSWPTWK